MGAGHTHRQPSFFFSFFWQPSDTHTHATEEGAGADLWTFLRRSAAQLQHLEANIASLSDPHPTVKPPSTPPPDRHSSLDSSISYQKGTCVICTGALEPTS